MVTDLSRAICEVNGSFSWNLWIFPAHHCAFNAQAEGVPLKFCNSDGAEKKYGDAPHQIVKKFTDMCICLDTELQCDGQTDRQKW